MFKNTTKILFASLMLSSFVPAGAWAADFTEDVMVTSEFTEEVSEERDFTEEEDKIEVFFEETASELEADFETELDEQLESEPGSETEIFAEAELESETEITKESKLASETELDPKSKSVSETESESESESEKDTEDEKEKTVESEDEDLDLFDATAVQNFIIRLYKNMLGRTPSSSEVEYWVNQLNNGKNSADISDGFIHSNEFKAKSLTNTAYIEVLYNTFLNRKSDTSGMNYWLTKLNNGMSRDFVYSGYVNSTEFAKLCKQYNIKTGKVTLTEARDQNEGVTTFTVRLYRKFLDRNADASGLNYWCNILLKGTKNAKEVAEGFALSKEFEAKKTSDDTYLKTLYQALLNRNADSTGLKYWKNNISDGYYRSEVFQEFADATEFRKLRLIQGINATC